MTNEPSQTQKLVEEVEQAEHDAWVAQVMLSTILETVGAVTITKDVASKDFSDKEIEITETQDGESLILQLVEKRKDVPDDES